MNLLNKINESEKNKIIAVCCTVMVIIVSVFSAGIIVSNNLVNTTTVAGLSKSEEPNAVSVRKGETQSVKARAIENTDNSILKLEKNNIALRVGAQYSIQLARSTKIENIQLVYSSSNSTVVSVNNQGVITAVSQGTAIVNCMDINSKAMAKLEVIVSDPVYPENIELDKTSHTLTGMGELLKLTATLTPAQGITEDEVKWISSDESVATVKNGLVTSVGEGVATITAYTKNDIPASCEVYVQPIIKCQELYLDYVGYEFNGPQSEPVLLTPTIYPADATYKTVKWYTTNEAVATVDQNGYVTITGDGMCSIVCSTTDGTYLSVECAITATNTEAVATQQADTNVYVPVNPVVADTVLDEALRYVGVIPYVWGGTDLATGVDCSGFICAVYERFGINLWGVRTDLYLAGTEVATIEEAKAGDILCYEGHVAIYDGNGGRVHAYDEGYMIIHDTNIDGYYSIRRIME